MKILGIDFGTVRIGLALQIEGIEMPLKTIENKGYRNSLKRIFSERELDAVVVGMPISMSGRYNQSAMKAVSFAEKVKNIFRGPVLLVDERLSTSNSKRVAQASGMDFGILRDTLSAMEILRNYSRPGVLRWEVKEDFPVCRDFPDVASANAVLLLSPKSARIENLDRVEAKLSIYTEDPQCYLAFLRKGFKPVNLIDDIDFSTYDIIVIARDDHQIRKTVSKTRASTVYECSWLNG